MEKSKIAGGEMRVGDDSVQMALLTATRLLFLVGFAVCLTVLAALVPPWLAAWPTLILLAAYLAKWGATLMEMKLPKSYIDHIDTRAVLITGCDSGFGLQLALRLHSLGATVFAGVLSDTSEGAKQLTELSSERVVLIPMDVTKDKDVKNAVTVVSSKLGDKKLQAIVNNAGVSAVTEVEWCPVDTYRQVLEVNALGPIRVTQAFLPLLRTTKPDSDPGRVVIVASLAGRYTFPGFTAYSMSKSAAVSFADGLRREMKKWSISVHTVEPTLYRTPISAVDQIQGTMQRHWDRSSDTIKSSYGEDYFQEFKNKILQQLERAKPTSEISEVVDDMVDAVFSLQPKMRYVPSVAAQFRSHVITAMPMPMQDFLLCQAQPSTPPAAVTTRRREMRRLSGENTARRTLQRLRSVPTWFLRHNSTDQDNVFDFPESESNKNKSTGLTNGKSETTSFTETTAKPEVNNMIQQLTLEELKA